MKTLAAVFLLLAAPVASACTCMLGELDTEDARAAKNVFVFQLVGAQYHDRSSSFVLDRGVEGTIRIVETLRGSATQYARVTYSTHWCCGSRMDLGHFYVAFVSDEAAEFQASSETVLDLGGDYLDDPVFDHGPRGMIPRIEAVLDGTKTLDEALGRTSYKSVSAMPPPPPPPCPRESDAASR